MGKQTSGTVEHLSLIFRSYTDCLDFLYQRDQFTIKLGLDNIRSLLKSRGSPQKDLQFIHVAGTNGKGSVCAYLAHLLSTQGCQKTGLYTSPHLVSFRERIMISGKPVSQKWIIDWMNKSVDVLEELGSTYFECVTAMAFEYFKEQGCDIAVIETGLGGRLDATNCIIPQISVITSISMDHMNMLGNSISEIWQEKIQIIKKGVPVVINEDRKELLTQLHGRAGSLGCEVWNIKRPEKSKTSCLKGAEVLSCDQAGVCIRGIYSNYFFKGNYYHKVSQLDNLCLAVTALEIWKKGTLNPPPVETGKFNIPASFARQQLLQEPGLAPIILDGAHNKEGIHALSEYLRLEFSGKQAVVLFTIMADKDYKRILKMVQALGEKHLYAELTEYKRALSFKEVKKMYTDRPCPWSSFTINKHSMEGLIKSLDPEAGLLIICGSFYLLGKVIPLLVPYFSDLDFFQQFVDESGGGH
jgi:dihydrofolate synthase/folylpolyglutamate synthase